MLLVNLQVKHGRGGNDVVEDVALDFFVVDPPFVAAESVYLQRHAKFGRLHLAHHHCEVVVQLGIVVDVSLDVGAENAQVGLLATVQYLVSVDVVGFVVFNYIFLFLNEIVLNKGITLVFLNHLRRAVADGVNIDVYGACNASSARFRHAAPIGERVGNQVVSRDGGDGVVPILHFHGGQVDFYDIAVGGTHHNPVAEAKHVVDGKLQATHESFDDVLENQQNDRRHGTQTEENIADFGAQNKGDDDQACQDVKHDFCDLHHAGKWLGFRHFAGVVQIFSSRDESTDNHGANDDFEDVDQFHKESRRFGKMGEGVVNQSACDEGGNEQANAPDDLVFDEKVVVFVRRKLDDAVDGLLDYEFDYEVDNNAYNHHRQSGNRFGNACRKALAKAHPEIEAFQDF